MWADRYQRYIDHDTAAGRLVMPVFRQNQIREVKKQPQSQYSLQPFFTYPTLGSQHGNHNQPPFVLFGHAQMLLVSDKL